MGRNSKRVASGLLQDLSWQGQRPSRSVVRPEWDHKNKMGVINDPLGQTYIHVSSEHYFLLKIVLYCKILRGGDRRTDDV